MDDDDDYCHLLFVVICYYFFKIVCCLKLSHMWLLLLLLGVLDFGKTNKGGRIKQDIERHTQHGGTYRVVRDVAVTC